MVLQALTLGFSVGSSLINGPAARRQAKQQRREIERREAQLEQTGRTTAASIEAAGRGAAAPLRREAALLEDAEQFRSPLLEQSLLDSVRQQAGQAVDRTSTSRNPGASRAAVVNALFQSRGLMARESARVERLSRLKTARADLLKSAGGIEVETAKSAAGARMSASQAIAGLPLPPSTPNTFAAVAGGALSSLNALSDEDRAGIEKQLGDLFGFGGDDDFEFGEDIINSTRSLGS